MCVCVFVCVCLWFCVVCACVCVCDVFVVCDLSSLEHTLALLRCPRSQHSIETAGSVRERCTKRVGTWPIGLRGQSHTRSSQGGGYPPPVLPPPRSRLIARPLLRQALEALAALPGGEGAGIVQDVLFIAAPVTSNPARWEKVIHIDR